VATLNTQLKQKSFFGALLAVWMLGTGAASAVVPERLVPTAVGPLATASLDSLHLAQATHLWLQDDLAGAATMLSTVDLREGGSFDRADRAAFLLGAAYLQLGERDKFLDVAKSAQTGSQSPYRQWLAYARLMISGATDAELNFPGAKTLTAAYFLEAGEYAAASKILTEDQPDKRFELQHAYLQALAAVHGGDASPRVWHKIGRAHV